MQAEGKSSDCVLKPVALYPDASRKDAYIVLSEVLHADGTPHSTNARATIENDPDLWIGFEQEYFLYQDGRPLGFLYQYSKNSSAFLRSDEVRATLGAQWNGFHLAGFADHQTQAPTIGFILAGVPGLQDALSQLAISATTPEQIALALMETAGLANQGFIEGININLSPVRLQAGTDLAWSIRTTSHQEIHFSFLYKRDDLLQGANQTAIGTLFLFVEVQECAMNFFHLITAPQQDSRDLLAGRQVRCSRFPFGTNLQEHHLYSTTPGNHPRVVFADDGATGSLPSRRAAAL